MTYVQPIIWVIFRKSGLFSINVVGHFQKKVSKLLAGHGPRATFQKYDSITLAKEKEVLELLQSGRLDIFDPKSTPDINIVFVSFPVFHPDSPNALGVALRGPPSGFKSYVWGSNFYITINDDVNWLINDANGGYWPNFKLLLLAAHEIGHSLGLYHSEDKNNIMSTLYENYDHLTSLNQDDIKRIQALYGKPI